jgi:hypothetical protein
MIHFRVGLPLVGDQMHAPIGCGTAKTKTFLRRKTQDQVGGSERLPLVGPGQTKNHQKGDPTPANLPAGFQAHPSMRICCVPHGCSGDRQRGPGMAGDSRGPDDCASVRINRLHYRVRSELD